MRPHKRKKVIFSSVHSPLFNRFLITLFAVSALSVSRIRAEFSTAYLRSYKSNNVQLDFSMTSKQLDLDMYPREQLAYMAIANQDFLCVLTEAETTKLQYLKSSDPSYRSRPDLKQDTGSTVAKGTPKQLKYSYPEISNYLIRGRFASAKKCVYFNGTDEKWTYELCFGKHLLKYIEGKKIAFGESLFQLGAFDPGNEFFWANGSVTQWYVGGHKNSSARVHFECSTSPLSVTSFRVEGNFYDITAHGPMFCDFRESNKFQPPLTLLLSDFKDWCRNFTSQHWWIYEYCYPDSLIQFHIDKSIQRGVGAIDYNQFGHEEDEIFLLGTLLDSPVILHPYLHNSLAAYPILRSPIRRKYKQNYRSFDNLSLHVVELPVYFRELHSMRSQNALMVHLTNGTYCPHIRDYRQSFAFFYCPENFDTVSKSYIRHLEEVSICVYHIFIAAPSVCSHPLLFPSMSPLVDVIRCYPETLPTAAVPSSFRDLPKTFNTAEMGEVLYPPQNRQPSVLYTMLEAIPAEATIYSRGHAAFGFGLYERSYSKAFSPPKFHIGQTVKHKWWGYIGIVTGWDADCLAPSLWIRQVYNEYPYQHQQWPHYAVMINQVDHALPEVPLYAYIPEIGLTEAAGGSNTLHHPHLSIVFNHFDASLDRWIPMFEVWRSYKCDFPPNFSLSPLYSQASETVDVSRGDETDGQSLLVQHEEEEAFDRPYQKQMNTEL